MRIKKIRRRKCVIDEDKNADKINFSSFSSDLEDANGTRRNVGN